jgi:hypothetical protein
MFQNKPAMVAPTGFNEIGGYGAPMQQAQSLGFGAPVQNFGAPAQQAQMPTMPTMPAQMPSQNMPQPMPTKMAGQAMQPQGLMQLYPQQQQGGFGAPVQQFNNPGAYGGYGAPAQQGRNQFNGGMGFQQQGQPNLFNLFQQMFGGR